MKQTCWQDTATRHEGEDSQHRQSDAVPLSSAPRARQVTAVVAPVSLAVYALGQEHISFLDSVTAGFGWFLAEHFEPEKAALFWVAIASLAASIYYGYGACPGLEAHLAGALKPWACCLVLSAAAPVVWQPIAARRSADASRFNCWQDIKPCPGAHAELACVELLIIEHAGVRGEALTAGARRPPRRHAVVRGRDRRGRWLQAAVRRARGEAAAAAADGDGRRGRVRDLAERGVPVLARALHRADALGRLHDGAADRQVAGLGHLWAGGLPAWRAHAHPLRARSPAAVDGHVHASSGLCGGVQGRLEPEYKGVYIDMRVLTQEHTAGVRVLWDEEHPALRLGRACMSMGCRRAADASTPGAAPPRSCTASAGAQHDARDQARALGPAPRLAQHPRRPCTVEGQSSVCRSDTPRDFARRGERQAPQCGPRATQTWRVRSEYNFGLVGTETGVTDPGSTYVELHLCHAWRPVPCAHNLS